MSMRSCAVRCHALQGVDCVPELMGRIAAALGLHKVRHSTAVHGWRTALASGRSCGSAGTAVGGADRNAVGQAGG